MNVITMKVTLRGTKPPVWRRLAMLGTMTLGDLHRAIQAAMGWHDSHLHAFDIGGEEFGDPGTVDDVSDENRVTLNGLLRSPVVRFTYTYDFGDNWEHTVAFEKSEPAAEGAAYPICTTGKRNCPPEDCGGVCGYQELLAILADPAHPDHAEYTEQIGDGFDSDEFDLELANTDKLTYRQASGREQLRDVPLIKYEARLTDVVVGGKIREVTPPVRVFFVMPEKLAGVSLKRPV